jgi:aryl-alcohol dehydrogenase-like predicted oxidoreductase
MEEEGTRSRHEVANACEKPDTRFLAIRDPAHRQRRVSRTGGEEEMACRPLGRRQVPVIGLGTARTFDVRAAADMAVRRQIIDRCIAQQVTFIDSSPMYGRSEQVIGLTTAGRRQHFQFATKVWCQGRARGEAQIAQSFQLLQTDYIDVFQIHNLLDW